MRTASRVLRTLIAVLAPVVASALTLAGEGTANGPAIDQAAVATRSSSAETLLAGVPRAADEEIERTLTQGYAHFRDARGLQALRLIDAWPALRSLPRGTFRATVVYLHGCDGIGTHGARTADWLADDGDLVLVPDSFARAAKPQSCDPLRRVGGLHREVLAWRHAEADHALRAALALPSTDPARLFLMGFSEGAIATATYRGVPLGGRVIEGWTCHAGWPEYAGIVAPANEAVLALSGEFDPWFSDPVLQGDCGSALGAADPRRRALVFRPPHPAAPHHDLMWNLEVRRLVLQFIDGG